MKFKVTFEDVIEAETEEDAYDEMIKYCYDVHNNEDVTAFNFEEVKEEHKTCVPVVPRATEEQRETLHRKAMGKQHKETHVEYEVFLRYGDEEGDFFVDVRKDIVDSDGDVVNGGEYIEGEIFDDYDKAKKRFLEFIRLYGEVVRFSTQRFEAGTVNVYNEVEDEKGSIT